MTRLDPIFIDSPENVAHERAKMEFDLDRMRVIRSEADGILAASRDEIAVWLESVQRAIERERSFLRDAGDVCEGEIASPYGLLQEAIGRFRRAQHTVAFMDREIEDTIQELADDDLWKPAAAQIRRVQ